MPDEMDKPLAKQNPAWYTEATRIIHESEESFQRVGQSLHEAFGSACLLDLVGNISKPIAEISNLAALLVGTELDKEQREYVRSIVARAEQALELLARLSAGGDSGQPRAAPPAGAIRASTAAAPRAPVEKVYAEEPAPEAGLAPACLASAADNNDDSDDNDDDPDLNVRGASRGRILVVEDNPINQKVAKLQLERLGYSIELAGNGVEALAALSRNSYDLILMDCQMPEMDGYTATREIRKLGGSFESLPIVALTAHANAGDREKCLDSGMSDYLTKPAQPEDLATVIEQWIAATRPPAPAQRQESDPRESQNLPPAVDLEWIDMLRQCQGDGNENAVKDLIDLFVDTTIERLSAIREGIRCGRAEQVGVAAHTLKGSSGNIGAKRLADLCFQLETMGKSSSLHGAAALSSEIETEFGRVKMVLEVERQKGAP